MSYDLLIFDLDGTLIDSQIDVGAAMNRVLRDYDVPPVTADVVREHVGYGVQPLMREALERKGVTDVAPALAKFTEYYFAACVTHTTLYPGVADLLRALSGYRNVILTNKSTRFVGPILDGLKIAHHFEAQFGRESFAKTKPDPLPIRSILCEFGVAADRAMMIGDTETDVDAGISAGVPTCLVTYGYGRATQLARLKPTWTIETPADLLAVLGPARVES